MRITQIIIITILFISEFWAQNDSLSIFEDRIFQLLGDASENVEDSQFYIQIENLMQNPIELNSATQKQLLRIPFFTPADAQIIIQERKKRSGFKSVNDLNTIDGIHPDLVVLSKYFFYISESISVEHNDYKKSGKMFLSLRSRIITDLQPRAGFLNENYMGNKLKSYSRIKAGNNVYQVGLLSEKDAGETSVNDHFIGFLEYKSSGLFRKIIIGDYNLEFGQGLTLWGPYSFSKGIEVINSPLKRARNIIPFFSSEENKFYRGIAFSIGYNTISLNCFYSKKHIDASISDSDEIENLFNSGYHRTSTEAEKNNSLQESVVGANLLFNPTDNYEFSLLQLTNSFNKPFSKENNYGLNGKIFSYSSLSFKIFYNSIHSTGEISYSNNSIAFITNLNLTLSKNIELLTSYRNYSPNYNNIHSNGFSEYGYTNNEIGYYLGLQIKSEFGRFNIYYDIFKSISKSYNSLFPIAGNDFLAYYNNKIFSKTSINLKYKFEKKEHSEKSQFSEKIVNEVRSNYRFELKYRLNKFILGKTRIEYVEYLNNTNLETGFLTYQELKYSIHNSISFLTRFILFETKSYNSRLYEFENDLQGVMTNLPMFGEGMRWYVIIKYHFLNFFNMSMKYSETSKPNETSISSGNSEIFGNLDNRISLQIDFKF